MVSMHGWALQLEKEARLSTRSASGHICRGRQARVGQADCSPEAGRALHHPAGALPSMSSSSDQVEHPSARKACCAGGFHAGRVV